MWVKHPAFDGDGEIQIATSNGAVTRKVVAGVLDWPDGEKLPKHFEEAVPPEKALKIQREEQEKALAEMAAKMGFKLTSVQEDTAVGSKAENEVESEAKKSKKSAK